MIKVWEIDGLRFTIEFMGNGEWQCINIEVVNGPDPEAS